MTRQGVENDVGGGEDRAFDADAAEVDPAVGLSDRRDAAKARAEAAGHVVLKRQIAGDRVFRDELGERSEHGGRSAAHDPRRPFAAFEA